MSPALVRPPALTRGPRHDPADATHLARSRATGGPRLREPGPPCRAAGSRARAPAGGPRRPAPGADAETRAHGIRLAPVAAAPATGLPGDPSREAGPAPPPRPVARAGRGRLRRPRRGGRSALGLTRERRLRRRPAPGCPSSRGQGRRPPRRGTAAAAAAAILPSVVQVRAGSSSGSGFVLDDRGHVMTNHHVIEGATTVRLQLAGGRSLSAVVVGSREADDIAVLRVEDRPTWTPPCWAPRPTSPSGESVIAVGSPLGLQGTVTGGLVSAVDREASLAGQAAQRMIQTDAPINPGNSGVPSSTSRGASSESTPRSPRSGGRARGRSGSGSRCPSTGRGRRRGEDHRRRLSSPAPLSLRLRAGSGVESGIHVRRTDERPPR